MAESRNKMQKQKLLTIGLLSRITDVSIKSLRYYEQIGILPPVYTDEKTGYRYYSFSQIYIIDAIRFCLELDIPLKTFKNFLSEDKTHIYYNKLTEYGFAAAEQKLKKLNDRIAMLKIVQQEIRRSENCLRRDSPEKYFLAEKHCLTVPYDGDRNTAAYNKCLANILMRISQNGWRDGYETGLLTVWRKGQTKRFIFAEFLPRTENPPAETEDVLIFPSADYICLTSRKSVIGNAAEIFSNHLNGRDKAYIFETELFTGDFNFSAPLYELRCLIC